MSTVEIAALTGKRHFHVLRDARLMLAELAGDNPDPNLDAGRFDGKYADEQGQERPCLMLPWRETMILVTGYSVPMRARVIDRWAELEAAEAARAALPVEPPQELFPPNALERLTGT